MPSWRSGARSSRAAFRGYAHRISGGSPPPSRRRGISRCCPLRRSSNGGEETGMEVILREDIEKLGSRGQMVKVAAGYARNFLLPKKLAVAATDSNRKIVEQERQSHLR